MGETLYGDDDDDASIVLDGRGRMGAFYLVTGKIFVFVA